MQEFDTAWPPAFTLKKRRGARYVRLKTSLRNGLELVVPYRFNKKEIPLVLETNKEWILKQFEKLRQEYTEISQEKLPNQIELAAASEVWQINYIPSNSTKVALAKRPQQQELVLLGNITDKFQCQKRLASWAKLQAQQILSDRLQAVSLRTGLLFNEISIRNQRSRWGSCSSNKKICLNYKLIFLPPHLCDHILIHELAHTVHLNHSEKFWQLVAIHDPNWKEHNAATRKAEVFIPRWLKEF